MLPSFELSLYLWVLDQAEACANAGDFAGGDGYLARGLRRARAFHRAGYAGGDELVEQYRYARDEYCTRYSVLAHWQPGEDAGNPAFRARQGISV